MRELATQLILNPDSLWATVVLFGGKFATVLL